jgi:hypothetical protein
LFCVPVCKYCKILKKCNIIIIMNRTPKIDITKLWTETPKVIKPRTMIFGEITVLQTGFFMYIGRQLSILIIVELEIQVRLVLKRSIFLPVLLLQKKGKV